MSAEHDLTVEQRARVDDIRRALEQELLATANGESPAKSALKDIEDLKGDFLETIKHVCKHADSMALRAKVAMWGFDHLIATGKATHDPLRELLDGMQEAAKKEKSVAK